MAEVLSSAIIGETVNRIISSHIGKDEIKSQEEGNIERLEMAHIKMEGVLQMSNKWPITDMPLLRWRRKLKRASQECDETLRRCKQRSMEEEEIRQSVSKSSFSKRIVHVATKFISSFVGYSNNNDELGSNSSVVRRFEWFAAGATAFLKYVELGGTPWEHTFFNPLIGHLLTGRSMRYQAFQESKYYYIGIRPMSFAERGVEAIIGFLCHDFKEPTKGFNLGFIIRLSQSTDIFNVITKCMESVTPHFKFAAEGAKKELIQLPTQDFSWTQSPYGESHQLLDNVHSTLTHWSRPNPLCCSEFEDNLVPSSNTSNTVVSSSRLLSSTFPEEVIVAHLQCQVSLCNQHRTSMVSTVEPLWVQPPLKLGVLFVPHDSPEDIGPAAESYAVELIDEKKQGMLHNNVCLQYLDEKLLPKAIDCLYQNSESKMYQMYFKTRHGSAYLCVEKASKQMQRGRRVKNKATRNARNKRITQQEEMNRTGRQKQLSKDLLKLWGQQPHVGQTYDITNLIKLWAIN